MNNCTKGELTSLNVMEDKHYSFIEAEAYLLGIKDSGASDLYEALKEVKLVWPGLDPHIKFPHLNETIEQALSKAEKKC